MARRVIKVSHLFGVAEPRPFYFLLLIWEKLYKHIHSHTHLPCLVMQLRNSAYSGVFYWNSETFSEALFKSSLDKDAYVNTQGLVLQAFKSDTFLCVFLKKKLQNLLQLRRCHKIQHNYVWYFIQTSTTSGWERNWLKGKLFFLFDQKTGTCLNQMQGYFCLCRTDFCFGQRFHLI